jgi:hypothetical protein
MRQLRQFTKPRGMPDALIRLYIYNLHTKKALLLEFCFNDQLLRALEIKIITLWT